MHLRLPAHRQTLQAPVVRLCVDALGRRHPELVKFLDLETGDPLAPLRDGLAIVERALVIARAPTAALPILVAFAGACLRHPRVDLRLVVLSATASIFSSVTYSHSAKRISGSIAARTIAPSRASMRSYIAPKYCRRTHSHRSRARCFAGSTCSDKRSHL